MSDAPPEGSQSSWPRRHTRRRLQVYAIARIPGWRDEVLIESVLGASLRRIGDFGPTDIAKLAWVLAKLQIKDDARELWVALSKEVALAASGGGSALQGACDRGRADV